MVDAAARAGVEVVKHQTHVVDDEMSGGGEDASSRATPTCRSTRSWSAARCPRDDERALKEYVESKGMIFISTPFSRAAADRLQRMNVPAFKIGSGECNNYPLLKHVASFGKPMILSTGMNTIDSVGKAVDDLRERARSPYALMHTTNLYPTPPHLVRLGAMTELMRGLSRARSSACRDHTTDNLACLGAVALGASILERHFTDRMTRPGPDIVCSMDPRQCRDLIAGAARAARDARRHQGSCGRRAGDDGLRVRDRRDDRASSGRRAVHGAGTLGEASRHRRDSRPSATTQVLGKRARREHRCRYAPDSRRHRLTPSRQTSPLRSASIPPPRSRTPAPR